MTVTRSRLLALLFGLALVAVTLRLVLVRPDSARADSLFNLDEGYGTTTADTTGAVSAGTITGATWKTSDLCRRDKCLFFDGSGDKVAFADDPDLDFAATNTFTVSGWFRHPTISTNPDYLVSKHQSGTAGGYKVYMDSDGDIAFAIDDDGTWGPEDVVGDDQSKNFDDNQWHFFSAVKDGTTGIYLYIDGRLIDQDTSLSATGSLANADSFYIGIDGDGSSNSFFGFLDEVKVTRRALSAAEIAADFLGQTTTFTGNGPVGWWKMDESSWTNDCSTDTVRDSSGNGFDGDACPNSTGPTGGATGRFGNAGSFDGSNDYIIIPRNSTLEPSSVSVAAWVKSSDPTPVNNNVSIVQKFRTEFDTDSYTLLVNHGAGDAVLFEVRLNSTDCESGDVSGIWDNSWHHIEGTFDGSYAKLYVDGVLRSTSGLCSGSIQYNTADVYIGSRGNLSSYYFSGSIDDVRIYGYTRSNTQVLEDMVASPPSGVSASFGPDESYLSNGLVGYWKLDESSGNAADSSGNGLTLTNNGTTSYTTGKFSYGSEHVPASSQYLSTATAIAGVKSVSLWVNPDVTTNYMVSLTSGAYVTASSGTISATGFTNPNIYVNGVASTTLTQDVWQLVTVTTDTAIDANQFYVGRQGSNYYDGTLDEVRLYNRALSPAEVSKLYNWAPGPSVYFDLNENNGQTIYDKSGNGYTGTLGSTASTESIDPIWSKGKFGSALGFDTTDDYSTLDNYYGFDYMTLEAWVYPREVVGDYGLPILFGGSATQGCCTWATGIGYGIQGNVDKLGFNVVYNAAGDADNYNITTSWSYSTNTWYHLVGVLSGSNMYLYVNGVLEASGTLPGARVNTSGSWSLGEAYSGGNNVIMDDVRLYGYARTPAQIIEDMNGGHPAPGSPVGSATAHWKFDEGYGTTAYDSNQSTGGSENLTLSSASWTNSGKFGKAFNGGDNLRLSRSTDPDLEFGATEDFTLSAWFKSDSTTNPGATEYLLTDGGPSGSAGYAIYANTSGNICFGIDDDTTWNPDVSSCTTEDYYDNTWHHALAVRNVTSNTTKIYIDGVEKDSDTDTTTATLDSSPTFYIGDANGTDGTDEFLGDIDEVKIYRSALTADQVKVEYNHGSGQSMGALSTDSSGNASNSDTDSYCPPGQGTTCVPPVGEWKFDENTGTAPQDSSTNGGTGSFNDTPSWVPGKYGSALLFNGQNGVDVPDSSSLLFQNGDITVETWVKLKAQPGLNDGFFIAMKQQEGSPYTSEFFLRYDDYDQDGSPNFAWRSGNGGSTTVGTTTATLDQWYHVVATFSDANNRDRIYVNGILEAENTSKTESIGNTSARLTLGRRYNFNDDGVEGMMDDVRIYNYERTPAQIAWDYNRGGPIGWWKLDENTGTTANDSSGFSRTGTVTNATWTTGKFNTSLSFDGSGDYVSLGSNAIVNQLTSYSISAWFKATSGQTGTIYSEQNGGFVTLRLFVKSGGLLESGIWSGSAWQSATSTATVDNGAWHLATVTFSTSTGQSLYIDEKLVDTDSGTTIQPSPNDEPYIGASESSEAPGSYFIGQIDDVRIFNYPLTPQQIKLIYNSGAVSF